MLIAEDFFDQAIPVVEIMMPLIISEVFLDEFYGLGEIKPWWHYELYVAIVRLASSEAIAEEGFFI